jgi:hypothetical protein
MSEFEAGHAPPREPAGMRIVGAGAIMSCLLPSPLFGWGHLSRSNDAALPHRAARRTALIDARAWRKYVSVGIGTLLLCACTARQAYEGVQEGKRHECARLSQSQQASCLEEANISYDEYQRRRREATASH